MNNINKKCPVTRWSPDKGYGFVTLDGRSVFIHKTVIRPQPLWEADLTGQTIVVLSTESGPKGLSVSRAVTLEEHEKEEARRADEARREEKERRETDARRSRFLAEEARKKAEQEKFRPRFQSELEAWCVELDKRVDGYEAREAGPEIPSSSLYSPWGHLVPSDLSPAYMEAIRAFDARRHSHYSRCMARRRAVIEDILQDEAREIGINPETVRSKLGIERMVWDLTTVRRSVVTLLQAEVTGINREKGRKEEVKIFDLTEKNGYLFGGRFEKPAHSRSSLQSTGVYTGIDGNGDPWRCDEGLPSASITRFELRKDLQAWVDCGHADHALRIVEEEIAILSR